MKKILLWDMRQRERAPYRLEIDDAVASACVRAGVAVPVDPADLPALRAGIPLSAGEPVVITLPSGAHGRMRQVAVPYAVAAVAVSAGVAVFPTRSRKTELFAAPTVVVPNGAVWTAASGGSVNNAGAYSKPAPSGRTQGLVFTKNPVSGTFSGFRSLIVPPDFRLSDHTLIGLDGLPGMSSGSASIRFSPDNFASKRVEYSWPMPAQLYPADWNRVTARVLADTSGVDPNGGWTVTGGMQMNEVINAVQISINTAANDAASFAVDQVLAWKSAPARGFIIFGFDRFTHESIVDIALPIAQKYGITMYAAGDTDLLKSRGPGYQRVKRLHDAGWPIPHQGPDHKNYVTVPPSVGAALLAVDYPASRQELLDAGLWRGADCFCYPFSANNPQTDAVLLAAGCKLATTGIPWNSHPSEFNGIGHKLIGMARINIGGMTWTQIRNLMLRAAAYRIGLDMFNHGVELGGDGESAHPDPSNLFVWSTVLEKSVAFAKQLEAEGSIDIHDYATLLTSRGVLPVTA